MKKLFLLSIGVVLINSCSSNPDTPEVVEQVNRSPSIPKLSAPETNLFCTKNQLDFKWTASTDPESDPITYIIQIATDSNFSNIYFTTEISSLSVSTDLGKGQNYYWRVRAKDNNENFSSYSEVRNFYTEEEPNSNSLPSVPNLVNPTEDVVSASQVELVWKATDPDDDVLTFDLYFGTAEIPELLEENLNDSSYLIENLSSGKTYYWKVVAKDTNGGKTIGQVWSFKIN